MLKLASAFEVCLAAKEAIAVTASDHYWPLINYDHAYWPSWELTFGFLRR